MSLTCASHLITKSDRALDTLNSALQKAALHKGESILTAQGETLTAPQTRAKSKVDFIL